MVVVAACELQVPKVICSNHGIATAFIYNKYFFRYPVYYLRNSLKLWLQFPQAKYIKFLVTQLLSLPSI